MVADSAFACFDPCPVLLIHGTADRLIVPENAHRLLAAASGNATLWEVPGAGHVQAVRVASNEYARRVLAFLTGALDGEGGDAE